MTMDKAKPHAARPAAKTAKPGERQKAKLAARKAIARKKK